MGGVRSRERDVSLTESCVEIREEDVNEIVSEIVKKQ